jgi:hypothetical protein
LFIWLQKEIPVREKMTKIEIVNDAGDEFSVTDVPIPFYIRCKLEEGFVRYRVRLLDDTGKSRGYYMGATNRDYLEVHVPVIPLREGKLNIEIELKDKDSKELGIYKTSIEYVDHDTYASIMKTSEEKTEPELKSKYDIEPVKSDTDHMLTNDELNYLTKRAAILKEDVMDEEVHRIKELSEIRREEEE